MFDAVPSEAVLTEADILNELAWEEEMRSLGIDRYRRQMEAAVKHRDMASTNPGLKLLGQSVERLTEAFAAFFEAAGSGKAGPKHSLYKHMRVVDPDTLAFLTAKTVIDGLAAITTVNSMIRQIGRVLQDELRLRAFNTQKPSLYRKIREAMVDERMASQERNSKLRHAFRTYEVDLEEWPVSIQAQIGAKCLDLVLSSTTLVEVFTMPTSRAKFTPHVRATAETMAWINDVNSRCELMTPLYMPTLLPPLDWEGPRGGGYYLPTIRRPLVKNRAPGYQRDLAKWDMPDVYAAVNRMQQTAWGINQDVFEVMQTLFDAGSEIAKLPRANPLDDPDFPENRKENPVAVRDWSRSRGRIRTSNERHKARRIALAKSLMVADKLKYKPRFYFPMMMDFRSRAYPRPLFLHPQGDDRCKALLRFADAMPLGDANGACWLAVHGANCWGFDKVSLQERIDWVTDSEAMIKACATNPYDNRWWTEADKPWCFLAFCFEWVGYLNEGASFLSRLPIALDGSCNGLQHFAIALRCRDTGAAVNLLPSFKPEDIYQRVADQVLIGVQAAGAEGDETARQWLNSGLIVRKLAKQPTMTLPYGAKSYGMRRSVSNYLEGILDEGKPCPWPLDDLLPPSIWITKLILGAIGKIVPGAQAVMAFLQDAARVACQEDKTIVWVSPIGFPVVQRYCELKLHRIKTQLQGEFVQFNDYQETDKIDKRKMASGISPNVVHSWDASHMMMTVNLAAEQGITSFAMIHDSYATHACNTETLTQCLRQAFVDQYEGDVLANWLDQIAQQCDEADLADLPALPARGDLDPHEVLKSDFFFA